MPCRVRLHFRAVVYCVPVWYRGGRSRRLHSIHSRLRGLLSCCHITIRRYLLVRSGPTGCRVGLADHKMYHIKCTIHISIISGACVSDICRTSVCDSSKSPMLYMNLALHFVAVPCMTQKCVVEWSELVLSNYTITSAERQIIPVGHTYVLAYVQCASY